MKCSLLVALFLLSFTANANVIGIGYYSKYAKIWRFYERNDTGGFDPKVLVYNVTNKPISVSMKVVLSSEDEMDAKTQAILHTYTGVWSDVVIRSVTIPPNSYGIYATEQLLVDRSTGFFDAFIINDERAGIMPVRPPLKVHDPKYRYYSNDGVAGAPGCLIGTNDLMVDVGETGRMTLYYTRVQQLRRNAWNINEWKFDLTLLHGDAVMTISDPSNKGHRVSRSDSTVSFAVDISKLDSFTLDATYKVIRNNTLPEIDLRRYSCNGCSNGAVLPVFLKSN